VTRQNGNDVIEINKRLAPVPGIIGLVLIVSQHEITALRYGQCVAGAVLNIIALYAGDAFYEKLILMPEDDNVAALRFTAYSYADYKGTFFERWLH